MKKIISILLLLAVAMSLVACNNQETTAILCEKCNVQISSDVNFCPSCGVAVGNVDNSGFDENVESVNNNISESDQGILQNEQERNEEENLPANSSSSSQSSNKEIYKCAECGSKCDKGHFYCRLDECSETSCLMQRKERSSYCVAHSCLLCRLERYGGSSYCYTHKCSSCKNAKVDGSDYCVSHKCLLCDRRAFGSTNYCSSHD